MNNNRPKSPELQLLKPGGKALIADFVPTHNYAIAFAEAGLTVESSKTYLTRVFVPIWMVVAGKKNSS